MRQLVLLGGTPCCATMHIAAFVHLHDSIFCFNSASGALSQLPDLHRSGQKWGRANVQGAEFDLTRNAVRFRDVLTQKNNSWTNERVFQSEIIIVRDDQASLLFKRHSGKPELGDRTVRLVYPVRRDIAELFVCQCKGILSPMKKDGSVDPLLEEFKTRLFKEYERMQDAMKEHPKDVLIVNLCDPDNRIGEYMKLLDFLQVEMNDLQQEWLSNEPRTNMFGEKIRRVANEVREHKFYRQFVE